jgi:hypothetical protein
MCEYSTVFPSELEKSVPSRLSAVFCIDWTSPPFTGRLHNGSLGFPNASFGHVNAKIKMNARNKKTDPLMQIPFITCVSSVWIQNVKYSVCWAIYRGQMESRLKHKADGFGKKRRVKKKHVVLLSFAIDILL